MQIADPDLFSGMSVVVLSLGEAIDLQNAKLGERVTGQVQQGEAG